MKDFNIINDVLKFLGYGSPTVDEINLSYFKDGKFYIKMVYDQIGEDLILDDKMFIDNIYFINERFKREEKYRLERENSERIRLEKKANYDENYLFFNQNYLDLIKQWVLNQNNSLITLYDNEKFFLIRVKKNPLQKEGYKLAHLDNKGKLKISVNHGIKPIRELALDLKQYLDEKEYI